MRSLLLALSILICHSVLNAQTTAQDRVRSNLATNEITGDALLTTHFVERGLSMSNSTPAMSASFLYNLGTQVRMGFWGSNISNISAADDSFWLKILAEFNVDFGQGLKSEFYVSDNHFYKSDQRNGLRLGANFNYYAYFFGFEWMSNYEGTRNNAEYIHFGRLWGYGNRIRYGGHVGYTLSSSSAAPSYFDAKAVAQYTLNTDVYFEAASTLNLSASNFGRRGDPFLFLTLFLKY